MAKLIDVCDVDLPGPTGSTETYILGVRLVTHPDDTYTYTPRITTLDGRKVDTEAFLQLYEQHYGGGLHFTLAAAVVEFVAAEEAV